MSRFQDDLDFCPAELPRHSPGLLQIAWRRKSLVLLGLLLGLAGAALVYLQRPPVYQSSAQILVNKKRSDAFPLQGTEGRYAFLDDYVPTHIAIIRSPKVVEFAVQKYKLTDLETFAGLGVEGATSALIAGLTVTRENKDTTYSSSNILNLNFRGPIKADCPKILNAIIESYRAFLDLTYSSATNKLLADIEKAQTKLDKDLKQLQLKYRDFRAQNPLYWKTRDGHNVHQSRVQDIESKRSSLLIRKAELEDRVRVFEAALKNNRTRAEILAMIPVAPVKAEIDHLEREMEQRLLDLRMQEQQLLEEVGKDHPAVLSVRRRIEMTKEYYAKARAAEEKKPKEDEAGQRDPLDRHLWVMKADLDNVNGQLVSLERLLKAEHEAIKSMAQFEIEDEHYRSNLESHKQLYDAICRRIQEIDLTREAGGYDATPISKPSDGYSAKGSPIPIVTGGVLLGLLTGCGLAYLAEVSDKSFRTPEEIRRRLGLPVVGHIPYIPATHAVARGGTPQLDPVLCAYHKPKSIQAESYRAVRTALYFSTQGHQVIQVTSPDMGDGKSTLVGNLALSIAQSGKRVVLVDADFRRPRLHKLFGLSAQVGLASVIAGKTDLDNAVKQTGVPNLSLLPCGPIPPNPAELLTSPRFKELLDQIREQYDYVLIDSPPLLAVTDPCVVAPRVDGVLLTIRVSRNGRPHAERAKEILATLGVKVIGVVVNGVGRQSGNGRYGSEYAHYGYDYGPGYSYSYQPDDGEASDYFSDGQTAAEQQANGTRTDAAHSSSGPSGRRRGFFRRLFAR